MPLVSDPSSRFEAYVGVRYAEPPLGDLRWTNPREPSPWNGSVYDATHYRPCCTQVLGTIQTLSLGPEYNNTDEDCLYLNVFRVLNTSSPDTLYPVMFWIHGGAYRYGSGEEYDSRILAQQGVVVVTINYRLGVMGFLSTDDSLAPGNFGLLDMVQGLRWVRDNIANFGGDPNQVTIFGNSAGGASTSLLLFSDLTEGLIHGVISQSGDALSTWAIYRPPDTNLPRAQELAAKVGCPTAPSSLMLDCLRTVDAELLVNTPVSGSDFNSAWAPRVDGYFIRAVPEELLAAGDFNAVPLFSGTVPDEVSDEFTDIPNIETGFDRTEKEQRMYNWSRRYKERADLIYASVVHEYDWPGNDYAKNRDLFIEMRSDFEYIAPHNAHSGGHSLVVPATHLYSFEHRSVNHPMPSWMGVPHFEECYYIYGTPFWANVSVKCPWGCNNVVWFDREAWTEEDATMSRRMMAAWTNFAKTGSPYNDVIPTWPHFESTSEAYVAINNTWTPGNYYKYQRTNFWNTYKPKLMNSTCY